MSVLIKGLKIPKCCWNCVCINEEFGFCQVTGETIARNGDVPKWCPIVEVPTPHGRLIDADSYKADRVVQFFGHFRFIDDMPTVIEAEEEE